MRPKISKEHAKILNEELLEEEMLKAKARKISVKEGCGYGVSEGFGMSYMTPYALALGATNIHIGLLTSIPYLVGSFSQLETLSVMKNVPRKKIVFISVLVQALLWLALIGIGLIYFVFGIDSGSAPLLVIITYTILITAGAFSVPAWTSWMKDIIPERFGSYFGTRGRIIGSVTLISMLLGGFILDYFKQTNLFIGFIILFLLAFIGRSISAYLYTKKYEPPFKAEKNNDLSLWLFLKKIDYGNFGRFTLFKSLMSFAIAIASPFFAVYMLKNLGFSYTTFIIMTISFTIGYLLFLPAWGRFADIYGNLKVLRLCGNLMPLIPFMWLGTVLIMNNRSALITYLLFVEIFAGLLWSGFILCSGDFIYDASTRQKMPVFTAYFNIVTNMGAFLGALLGGLLSTVQFKFFGLSSILFVFLLSGIARIIISAAMIPKIREVRKVEKLTMLDVKNTLHRLTPYQIIRMLR